MRRLIASTLLLLAAATSNAASLVCSTKEVFFVNGINTTWEEGLKSLKILQHRVLDDVPTATRFELSHNSSSGMVRDLIESLYQKAVAHELRISDISHAIYGVAHGSGQALAEKGGRFPQTFAEQLRTALEAHLKAAAHATFQKDLERHVRSYQKAIEGDRGIFLVGHSQGSLFVDDAFYLLDRQSFPDNPGARAQSGGYYVAPAAGALRAPFVNNYIKARSDVLAVARIGLPGNTWLYTPQERATALEANLPPGLAFPVGDALDHGFATTYLNYTLAQTVPAYQRLYAETRKAIRQAYGSAFGIAEGLCGWTFDTGSGYLFSQEPRPLALAAWRVSVGRAGAGQAALPQRCSQERAYYECSGEVVDPRPRPGGAAWGVRIYGFSGWLWGLHRHGGSSSAQLVEGNHNVAVAKCPAVTWVSKSGSQKCISWQEASAELWNSPRVPRANVGPLPAPLQPPLPPMPWPGG